MNISDVFYRRKLNNMLQNDSNKTKILFLTSNLHMIQNFALISALFVVITTGSNDSKLRPSARAGCHSFRKWVNLFLAFCPTTSDTTRERIAQYTIDWVDSSLPRTRT